MALVNNGDSQQFDFTGKIQTITLTKAGVYKLECWGAGTSNTAYDSAAAKGGYVSGYKYFDADTTLYIVVGGSNGYNGGGAGCGYHDPVYAYFSCSNGGGATHIADVTGLLSAIGETNFVDNGHGYLIAGGAGGSETFVIASGEEGGRNGGAGGTGGNNGKFGYGSSHPGSGRDDWNHGCGGGAGFRGGSYSNSSASGKSGGGSGGTNWNAGCPTFTYNGVTYKPTSESGKAYGNGKAVITLTAVAYTVTVSKNIDSNLLSVSGGGEYGANVSVTLNANITSQGWGGDHYRFDGWYLNNSKVSSSASYTITVSSNADYVARFVKQANIATSRNPNGSGTITGAGLYDVGTVVSVQATENYGFAFVNWTVEDSPESGNPLSITVSEDTRVVANFTSAYNIETHIVGQGSLNTVYTTSGLTITAIPATHWGFVNIKVLFLDNLKTNLGENITTSLGENIMVGGTSTVYTTNPITIVISNDIVIEATFEYIGKELIRRIHGIGGENDVTVRGSLSGPANGTYDRNTTITLIATPAAYHDFDGWYVDGVKVSSNTTYSFQITRDITVIAKFKYQFAWIPVIKNRTEDDIVQRTAKAYLNLVDILRLEKDLGYIESYYNLTLQIDITWNYGRYIYQSDFTRLLNRLRLCANSAHLSNTIPTHILNTYQKLNEFENILDRIYIIIN